MQFEQNLGLTKTANFLVCRTGRRRFPARETDELLLGGILQRAKKPQDQGAAISCAG
jgi:hypothetical protein